MAALVAAGPGGSNSSLRVPGCDIATTVHGESRMLSTERFVAAIWGNPCATGQLQSSVTDDALLRLCAQICDAGPQALAGLAGQFALILFDRRANCGIAAIDRIGTGTLFYRETSEGVAIGDAPVAVTRAAGAAPAISPQAIFDYMFFHMVPGARSIVAGTNRLLPGQYLHYADGRVHVGSYWEPRFIEDRRASFADLKAEFRSLLQTSVGELIRNQQAGAFLSGGTDSSTVVGMMAANGISAPECFSIGFDAEGYDEISYARLAAQRFGANHHVYYLTPQDVTDAIVPLARIHSQPFGNSSAVPTFYCARLAREHGRSVLLGGDGGDELFGGNARYATQYVFSLYERLPVPLRNLVLEPLADTLSRHGRLPVIGKLVSYIQQARIPMPERLEAYNLLNRLGTATILAPELLAGVDQREPCALLSRHYFGTGADSLINRMLSLDFQITLADSDLPKVVRGCELADVPVRFPFLDNRIMDFSLRLAPDQKLRRTRLRYFFKRALEDFLPTEIINKKKHGFGLPYGVWLQSHAALRDITHDSLARLKRRNLIRADFLDRVTGELLPQHPGYYGTLVWVMVMLEQWLQAHVDAPAAELARA